MNIKKIFKHFFDKSTVKNYNVEDKWALVRNMFPGIKMIEDKRALNILLESSIKEADTTLRKLLETFYRSKSSEAIDQKRYQDLVKYEGILELIDELNSYFNNNNNYGERK